MRKHEGANELKNLRILLHNMQQINKELQRELLMVYISNICVLHLIF